MNGNDDELQHSILNWIGLNQIDRLQPTYSTFSCRSELVGGGQQQQQQQQQQQPTRILILDFGMKHSIVRSLLQQQKHNGIVVDVVPYDTNLVKEMKRKRYHALIISNGPGNPSIHQAIILHFRQTLIHPADGKKSPFFHLPVLGICLGFQLLALALNHDEMNHRPITSLHKLSFGHRGFNHPVIVTGKNTNEGYMTSQNHGYSVHLSSQPQKMNVSSSPCWAPWFTNVHDNTHAGFYFIKRPILAVQFHPEGGGGPWDTKQLIFESFVTLANEYHLILNHDDGEGTTDTAKTMNASTSGTNDPLSILTTWPPQRKLPRRRPQQIVSTVSDHPTNIKTVLVLGSGGIVIGQAGEFDYAGTQCLKTLRQNGIRTILVNPNVASSQTMTNLADVVYFAPLEVDSVEDILNQHTEIDGILLSFGGQTALNVGFMLHTAGILRKNNVQILGTPMSGIAMTEDRKLFKKLLEKVNEKAAPSVVVTTLEACLKSANQIGYPVLIRRAYALGGLGSAFAKNKNELIQIFAVATSTNDPNNQPAQIIIDKSLLGWKEIEYDVMRDQFGNTIVICNMENLDPVGVHTGESIVVAPSQTLDDHAYQTLRTASIQIANEIGIIGEW